MDRRGGGKRDIKSRTRVNYTVFDEDVGSRYEYDDDDSSVPIRQGVSRGFVAKTQARRDNQILRVQATGTNMKREMVYLITIRNCARSGMEYVLNQVAESVDHFRPIAPKINQGHIEFYMVQSDDADAVKSLSRRIVDRKTGAKLVITMARVAAPWEPLKSVTKMLIEKVVRSRYSSGSNSLDLGDFVNDKEFVNANLLCPLFKNEIIVQIATVVSHFFSSLQGFSLKGNRLRALDYISTLVYAVPKVTELDLSSNALSRIEELDRIRGWRIEKLHLENNECVSKFGADAAAYASAVQNYFPRVSYLDGVFVTQDPLKLSVQENDGFILPYKLGYTPDDNARAHVERFILEYLSLYDGPNGEQTRKGLMNAYDDNATMTFAIHRLKDAVTKSFSMLPKGDEEAFSSYIRSSHNIICESRWGNYRDKIIYKGSMDIAVAISKLPLTTHLKESFILDFNFISADAIIFTLQGLLRDGKSAFKAEGDYKLFVRNMAVMLKDGNRMAIISDMLSLTPITSERMERYVNLMKKGSANDLKEQQQPSTSSAIQQIQQHQQMVPSQSMPTEATITNQFNMLSSGGSSHNAAPAPPSTPQPPVQSMDNAMNNASPATAPAYNINDPTIRRAMVEQFSAITKMKPIWSEKCLADCQWDYLRAGEAFTMMNRENRIPAEAFAETPNQSSR